MARNDDNTPPNFPLFRQIAAAGNINAKGIYHNGKEGRSSFASVPIAVNSRHDGFAGVMFIDAQLFGNHADYAKHLKEVGENIRVSAVGDLTVKVYPLKDSDALDTPEDYDENPDDYGLTRLLTNVSQFGPEHRWFNEDEDGSSGRGGGRRRGRGSRDDGDDGNETRTRRSRSRSDSEEEPDTTSRRRSRRSSSNDDAAESNDSADATESKEESSSGGSRRRRRSRVEDEGNE